MRTFHGLAEVEAAVGEVLGPTEWHEITQGEIQMFADATHDQYWIHTDPVRAADGPFGGTIAHGFLLLSLLPQLHAQSDRPALPTLAMAVNYGFDRVRFVTPVRVGSAVRAQFSVASLFEKRPGEWQQELDEKFYLPSVVLDGSRFNQLRNAGNGNPFMQDDAIVIYDDRPELKHARKILDGLA